MKLSPLNNRHFDNFSTERMSHKAMLKPTGTCMKKTFIQMEKIFHVKNRRKYRKNPFKKESV